jgi:D-xylose transport system ATP-binding protein
MKRSPLQEGFGGADDEPARIGMPLVEMRDISKFFGGVAALDHVSVTINRGEVLALLGDNGAGKSTLIKILAGVLPADAGEILLEGRRVAINSPHDAKRLGIETVYQDLALCDNLDVPANVFLGRERMRPLIPRVLSVFDQAGMREETTRLLASLKIRLGSLDTTVRNLSGGQRQSIAIAKSVYFNAKLSIMDEPTAALGVAQTRELLELVRNLKRSGHTVVYISHIMEDVFQVADRMVVLKNGRYVGEREARATGRDEVVQMMITGEDRRAGAAS